MGELWTVAVAAAALLALTLVSATADRALSAGAAGRPVGPALLLPFREAAGLLVQRRRTTSAPDALLWRVGGGGLLIAGLLMVAVVPVGGHVAADLAVGVVWFNAMDVLLWVLLWSAGWGAGSAPTMIAGYRYLAQALAYELPLMFALVTPALAAGSLNVGAVVADQSDHWNVVEMPLAFLVVLVGVAGFSFWGPLSAPADDDLAGGLLAETSGVDRLLVLIGRHAVLAAGATMMAVLFLGGGAGPWLPGPVWQLLTTLAVLGVLVLIRRRLPVLRPERFAPVGWLVLMPLTVLQLLVTSLLVLAARR